MLKKENEKLKKQIKRTKTNKIINKTTNINNQQNINQQNNINVNIINFTDLDYDEMYKKLFTNSLLNSRLQGKFIILQMIENIYINEAHSEYQNIMITYKK